MKEGCRHSWVKSVEKDGYWICEKCGERKKLAEILKKYK